MYVDLEKAFDRILREVIWRALRRKGVMKPEVRAVMEMHKEAETSVTLENKMSNRFQVKVGVHQGSVLCTLPFVIVIDAINPTTSGEVGVNLTHSKLKLLLLRDRLR